MNGLVKLYATVLGSGYVPYAPGTAGTLVGLIIYWLLPLENQSVFGILILTVFILGVPASTALEKVYGKDASQIVIDEVVGMWISLWWLPKTWVIMLLGFGLFRLFDIWKPFPINRAQELPHGWGVMIDDIIAGIYTNVLLHILLISEIQYMI